MAVRTTNAGRPSKTGSGTGTSRDPRAGSRDYTNHDGPIVPGGDPRGETIDYGPHRPRPVTNFGSPRWSDRNPAFDATPGMLASQAAARQPYIDAKNALLGGDAAYQAAKAAGDLKGQIAAMTRLKQQGQRDRFIEQGGRGETWDTRFAEDANWPVPKSPLGVSSHGPGRSDYPGSGGSVAGTASTKSADGGSKGKATPTPMPAFVRSLWGTRDWRTGEAPKGGVGMIEGYIPSEEPRHAIENLNGGALPEWARAASTGAGEAAPRGNQGFFGSLDRMARWLDGLRAEDMIPGMELPVDQSLGGFAQALKSADTMRKAASGMPAHLLDPNYKPGSRGKR